MQLFTLSRNWRGCHDNELENFIVLRIDLSFYFWNLDLLFKCRKEIITDFLIHLDKFYFKNLRRKGTASPTFQNEACRNIEIDLPFNFKIGAWLWNETRTPSRTQEWANFSRKLWFLFCGFTKASFLQVDNNHFYVFSFRWNVIIIGSLCNFSSLILSTSKNFVFL